LRFNPEITLGTIISTVVFVATIVGSMLAAVRKFGVLEAKLNIMYHWFEKKVLGAGNHEDTERFFGKKG
jgi:hypothetical protein